MPLHPGWREWEAERRRAEGILRRELPYSWHIELLPLPSPGHATWVNTQYEAGVRGVGLDYREAVFEDAGPGSSSCDLRQGKIKADGCASMFELDTSIPERLDSPCNHPPRPHRGCVSIDRSGPTIRYFGEKVVLRPQLIRMLAFYAAWGQSRKDPAPDAVLISSVRIGKGTELRILASEIRHAFRVAAENMRSKRFRETALILVKDVTPLRVRKVGYMIPKPELFIVK